MHLAGAVDGVCLAALAGAAVDVAWIEQIDGDRAGDTAQGPAPADDAGDGFLVHAIL
jgi:hypothetical protein